MNDDTKRRLYNQVIRLDHEKALYIIDILTSKGSLLGLPLDIRIEFAKAQAHAKDYIEKIKGAAK